jgi:hypothetical protein
VNKSVLVILLLTAVAGGVYYAVNGTKQRGAEQGRSAGVLGTDSLNRELEQVAREKVPLLVRASERGHNKAMDFVARRPEGTTKSETWTGKVVKTEARRLEAEKEFDAAGFVTYEITKADGTTERETSEMRRKRSDGKWEFYAAPATLNPATPAVAAAPDAASTRADFEAFARRFLLKIAPALNGDATFKGYMSRFELTRNPRFTVDTKDGSVVGRLSFDAGSVSSFATDSYISFNSRFELVGGRWQFAGGDWVHSGERSALNETTSATFATVARSSR